MRKIDGHAAKVLEEIIQYKDKSFEMNGRHYKIVEINSKNMDDTTVADDVEKDPLLKQKLKKSKNDIKERNYYTSDEMKDMIRRGQI